MHFTDEVFERIEFLESKESLIPPQDAEQVFLGILTPLLTGDGYGVKLPSYTEGSFGIDLKAVQYRASGEDIIRIGFQFKYSPPDLFEYVKYGSGLEIDWLHYGR